MAQKLRTYQESEIGGAEVNIGATFQNSASNATDCGAQCSTRKVTKSPSEQIDKLTKENSALLGVVKMLNSKNDDLNKRINDCLFVESISRDSIEYLCLQDSKKKENILDLTKRIEDSHLRIHSLCLDLISLVNS